VERYRHTLYLCVGSVYTGNYSCAMEWKDRNDPENRLTVVDTGAASGRLGTAVIATARAAAASGDFGAVVEFARKAVDQCMEFVFLDKLKYLAAGGRLSKSGAFLGDMFHARPIITPTAEGAKKVGLAKNRRDQLAFALRRLAERFRQDAAPLIMLEYSDNREWVAGAFRKRIEIDYPRAEILVQPLSLTSGAHMGPGTWGIAYLPDLRSG
jgi:DegV family protein with EDD domain